MDFFDIFDEINLQKIDNVQITPDEEMCIICTKI